MNNPVTAFWQSRAPSERRTMVVMSALLAVGLYGWLLYSTAEVRPPLRASVQTLHAQAATLELYAAELEALRAAAPASPTQTVELREFLLARATAAGLASALNIELIGPDEALVISGAVGFREWLGWIDGLRDQGLRVQSSRIEALSTPGLVSVSATLTRTRS